MLRAESSLRPAHRHSRSSIRQAIVLTLAMLSAAPTPAQTRAPADPSQLAREGWAAAGERRFGDALDAFQLAATLAPGDADLWLGAGFAAAMLGQTSAALGWLQRALTLQPHLTEASIVLGDVLHGEGHVGEAIDVYETALAHAPAHPVLTHQLEAWRRESAVQTRFYQAQGVHFTVLFEGPSDDVLARRVVDILEAAYYRLGTTLSTYPTRTVTVVLYTLEQFRDITRSPSWSGGMYDGRITIPIRNALDRPEELRRVLEHELVHATVATIAGPGIPTWLNEGLATALEPGGLDWARRHLETEPTRLAHAELATGFGRLSAPHARAAYAQSAVAVKKMLDLRGAPAVVSLLQALGRGVPFTTAFQQTIFMRYEDFVASLR